MLSSDTGSFPTTKLHFCNLKFSLAPQVKILGVGSWFGNILDAFVEMRIAFGVLKKRLGHSSALEIHVVLSNIPDSLIGKKILLIYLIFGCCFALAVYLFRRWQRRSGQPKPGSHSYADQLTDRFNRNRKRDQALQSTRKTKSTRPSKR